MGSRNGLRGHPLCAEQSSNCTRGNIRYSYQNVPANRINSTVFRIPASSYPHFGQAQLNQLLLTVRSEVIFRSIFILKREDERHFEAILLDFPLAKLFFRFSLRKKSLQKNLYFAPQFQRGFGSRKPALFWIAKLNLCFMCKSFSVSKK